MNYIKDMNINSNKNYPSVKGCGKDVMDAKMLMNAYAGKESEFTASSLYSYQHFLVKSYDEEIAEILEEIAIVEMVHLDLLAEAIIELGGNPTYQGMGGYWNASYVNYSRNLKQMLQIDIKAEENAIMDYKRLTKTLNNECVIDLIEAIIKDEEEHLAIFKELFDKVHFWC